MKLIQLALRVMEDEVAALGLPCTSFVFMNSGTHCRSESHPYGAENLPYIQLANMSFGIINRDHI